MLPTAKNYIFRESDKEGNLIWDHEKNDPERPPDEQGYIQAFQGDSGSPYWTTRKDDGEAETRSFLVAIVQGGKDFNSRNIPAGHYGKNPQISCRMYATKITEDIANWLLAKGNPQ